VPEKRVNDQSCYWYECVAGKVGCKRAICCGVDQRVCGGDIRVMGGGGKSESERMVVRSDDGQFLDDSTKKMMVMLMRLETGV
jgi:hypothetical protein